jgi:dihydrofolate reductase
MDKKLEPVCRKRGTLCDYCIKQTLFTNVLNFMRKIFLHTIVSLDGYIEGPNGELDWQFVDDEFEEYINTVLRSIGGMVYGRKSYQVISGYWPTAAENPAAAADPSNPQRHIEAAHLMNSLPKYVVSSTLEKTEWINSHIIRGDVAGEIVKLKELPGKDLALFAGAQLTSSLMELKLIDEYRLIVYPEILGGGTPLFRNGQNGSILKLIDMKKFTSGAVLLEYKAT